jgi:hypothetical protein
MNEHFLERRKIRESSRTQSAVVQMCPIKARTASAGPTAKAASMGFCLTDFFAGAGIDNINFNRSGF